MQKFSCLLFVCALALAGCSTLNDGWRQTTELFSSEPSALPASLCPSVGVIQHLADWSVSLPQASVPNQPALIARLRLVADGCQTTTDGLLVGIQLRARLEPAQPFSSDVDLPFVIAVIDEADVVRSRQTFTIETTISDGQPQRLDDLKYEIVLPADLLKPARTASNEQASFDASHLRIRMGWLKPTSPSPSGNNAALAPRLPAAPTPSVVKQAH